MKAIILEERRGPEGLSLVERPIPEPRRQELLIRVGATSLNYRDVEIVNGTYHTAFALPLLPLTPSSAARTVSTSARSPRTGVTPEGSLAVSGERVSART